MEFIKLISDTMLDALKRAKDGTFIEIEVVANSSDFKIEYNKWSKRIKLKITSPAIKGQANKEIQTYFSEIFGSATIVKGEHNKKKTILVNSNFDSFK